MVGHTHKIVPFIAHTAPRARGVTAGPTGRPLLFGDPNLARGLRRTASPAAAAPADLVPSGRTT